MENENVLRESDFVLFLKRKLEKCKRYRDFVCEKMTVDDKNVMNVLEKIDSDINGVTKKLQDDSFFEGIIEEIEKVKSS